VYEEEEEEVVYEEYEEDALYSRIG